MKHPCKSVVTTLQNGIISLNESIKSLEQQAENLVLENAKELYEKLTSIPSIGKKSAIMLIAVSNAFKNFENSKQLASYLGISPRVYQ